MNDFFQNIKINFGVNEVLFKESFIFDANHFSVEKEIYNLEQTRQHFVNFLSFYSLEQLNKIPTGFKNNIFWNCAHILATQQLLHYYLSSNSFRVDEYWINSYKKGTLVEKDATEKEVTELKELLLSTPALLLQDYKAEELEVYQKYKTSFGVEIKSIEEAIQFNNMHESLHLGYIMAIRKLL